MLWSLGCAFASYRERIHMMSKSSLNVARWVLGLEVLVCLGPLTLLWIVTACVVGTTGVSTASVLVPIAIATVGPLGLLLAIRTVVMRRAVHPQVFAVLACVFVALALLQITGVATPWFAFDWRVWLLDSVLPGLACAHLAWSRSENLASSAA
jgi:hypothetical protein